MSRSTPPLGSCRPLRGLVLLLCVLLLLDSLVIPAVAQIQKRYSLEGKIRRRRTSYVDASGLPRTVGGRNPADPRLEKYRGLLPGDSTPMPFLQWDPGQGGLNVGMRGSYMFW